MRKASPNVKSPGCNANASTSPSSNEGAFRTNKNANTAITKTPTPPPVQAARQPDAHTAAPTAGNAAINPIATSNAKIPIARFNRRANHFPTSAKLTTDSALCPSARVNVSKTNNTPIDRANVIPNTANPNPSATQPITTRAPHRSVNRPTGKHSTAPNNVAHKFTWANTTRLMPQSASSGSVTSPNPCVRPGSVATIASAASTRFTHP